jgi:hypothetical protein
LREKVLDPVCPEVKTTVKMIFFTAPIICLEGKCVGLLAAVLSGNDNK